MDYCSYFIPDKALFGSYPTTDRAKELENNGVTKYVDLTMPHEVKASYETSKPIIHFAIIDRKIPYNIYTFCKFIIQVANMIKESGKIYIHCRGGHGRSGLVVACLLCFIYKYSPEQSIERTTFFHSQRKIMREKWRQIGSPQTRKQKSFVFKLFKPLYFYKAYKCGPAVGLSNLSLHGIEIKELGNFKTSLAAYEAYRDLDDVEYIKQLENCNAYQARLIGIRKNTEIKNKRQVMKNILQLKLDQHPIIKQTLINTGFRQIFYTYKFNKFWGLGEDHDGDNELGKLWMELRKNFYY